MENGNGNNLNSYANGHRYVFDRFEIDPANRTCLREGVEVTLTARVFDVLLVFAENPGRLLAKEELIEKVWRGDFVEEGNVARTVSTLRKALGDDAKDHKYIATVQGHGYRFVADVIKVNTNGDNGHVAHATDESVQGLAAVPPAAKRSITQRYVWLLVALVLVGLSAAVWFGRHRLFGPSKEIKSLAVLPLRSLESNDDYLGLGIADAVIRRISQTGQLTVRPTSAVVKYLKTDTDSLAIGHQLNADAVLEGNVQRDGDRMRISVNLLRTADGVSIWADRFDLSATDIFAVEDAVSQRVASRLELHRDQRFAELSQPHPSSAAAYDYYVKGIYHLDQRGFGAEDKPQMETAIGFLKQAIDLDPNYSLAHAQLAYAYVWNALFIEPENPQWARLAREEIKQTQAMNPYLAESHRANGLLLWSTYEGCQNEAAIRELLLAQQLNPSIGHEDLAAIAQHVGLDDLAMREAERAIEIDPSSNTIGKLMLTLYSLRDDSEAWLAEYQKQSPNSPLPAWYLLRNGRLDEAERTIEDNLPKYPGPPLLMHKGLLLALRGNFHGAEAVTAGCLDKINHNHPSRHHLVYEMACIYALEGKSHEAVELLKETAATGYPDYLLFNKDHYLDRIRQTPEFVSFLADQKAHWEELKQEFGG